MRWIVGMILSGWLLTASAQFGLGLLLQGIMATQGPSLGDAREMARQGKELEAMRAEMERMKRFGRFDEAEALNKRYYELMESGPLGRMLNEGYARNLQQQPPAGSPQAGTSTQSITSVAQLGAVTSISLRRENLDLKRSVIFAANVPTLFVHPKMIWVQQAEIKQAEIKQAEGRQTQIPVEVELEALNLFLEGQAHMMAKDYDAAEQSFAKAYSLTRSPMFSTPMLHLDELRGRSDAALQRFQSEIEAAEKEDPRSSRIASLLWRQASIHSLAGAHDRATAVCERALAIVLAGGANTAENAAGQNNLGVVLQAAGNSTRALGYYERSFGVLQEVIRNTPPKSAQEYQMHLPTVATNLGLAHWQLGNLARAADSFRIAFEERALYEFAWTAFPTERAQLAKAQAVSVELHAIMTLERAAGSKGLGLQILLERKGALLEQRTRALASFRRGAQAKVEPPRSEQSVGGPLSLLGRLFGAPATREQLAHQRDGDPAIRQLAEDQDLLREYEAVVRERAAIPRTTANAARIADLDTRIEVMQLSMQSSVARARARNDDADEIAAIGRNHAYDPMKAHEAITALRERQRLARQRDARNERAALISRVQASIPKDGALLEMVRYRPLDPRADLTEEKRWGPPRYGTFVIQPEGEAQYVDLGEAGPLDKLIAEFRAALADPTRAAARDLGRRLDEALMRPMRSRLGNARTLYVAPEGSLNLIPLGALVDENGSYLLENYTINYLASGRDLLHLGRKESTRGPAIIFADPAFDGQAGTVSQPVVGTMSRSVDFRLVKFDRLPGTAAEAQSLKRILPEAVVLTGSAATETAAKNLAGPRILHIATHGFFLDDQPDNSEDPMLRSGLVFAGVNAPSSADDDGVLTALEASNIDLRGTKLVVLSACETGLGDVRNGEGVFGLRRAFVVAGAESLLMSLWPVADDATKDLMTSYYTLLSRGEARAEALRQTQIAMLKNPATAHPFFWAAFISSGETGSLK